MMVIIIIIIIIIMMMMIIIIIIIIIISLRTNQVARCRVGMGWGINQRAKICGPP